MFPYMWRGDIMHSADNIEIKSFRPVGDFLTINDRGHLTFEGLDATVLARKYGTPVYVMSEGRIRENTLRWVNAFRSRYPRTRIFYALKANPLLAVCAILKQEGAGLEVGGQGELHVAQLLDAAPGEVILNGNNKSRADLGTAIAMGAILNVDSIQELKTIQQEAEKKGAMARVAFRVNPDVRPEDESIHQELWTGIRESKFGIDVASGLALEAYKMALGMENLKIVGIHTHIGSPVEDVSSYRKAAERIMEFTGLLKRELGISLSHINLGGGFAIPFKHKAKLPSPEEYAEAIIPVVKQGIARFGLNELELMLEPGGAIVGDSAILLLTVGMIKESHGLPKWVAVDGGANIILRASQGWYTYQIVAANRMLDGNLEAVNIAGPLCYSGDVIARDRKMPQLVEGDILAVLDAGAYTFAYEFHGGGGLYPLPPVALINNDRESELVRRGESLSDVISRDILPKRLLAKLAPST
jgi:diaminopimelate decarboxylase